jgi:hypothetical protein
VRRSTPAGCTCCVPHWDAEVIVMGDKSPKNTKKQTKLKSEAKTKKKK